MENDLLLPIAVVSKADLIRLKRELESIDDFMNQARVRKSGQALSLPQTSVLLEQTAQVNNLKLLQDIDRAQLNENLEKITKSAPIVHISFASTPGPKFIERIVSWFRQEVDPSILIEVGMQPSIAAGCTLRTTNKYLDLSLRSNIAQKQSLLFESLRGEAK